MGILASIKWYDTTPEILEVAKEISRLEGHTLYSYEVRGLPPITEDATIYFIYKDVGRGQWATGGSTDKDAMLDLFGLLAKGFVA